MHHIKERKQREGQIGSERRRQERSVGHMKEWRAKWKKKGREREKGG